MACWSKRSASEVVWVGVLVEGGVVRIDPVDGVFAGALTGVIVGLIGEEPPDPVFGAEEEGKEAFD